MITLVSAQNVNGIIYNKEGRLRDITITNITQNKSTSSGDDGNFVINGKINDSIQFSSMFYKKKTLRISNIDLSEEMLIVLNEKVFELEEVVVKPAFKFKEFDSEEFNQKLRNEIKEDIKKHPSLYQPPSDGRLDLIKASNYIGSLIGNLLKNKNKKYIEDPTFITYNDLKSLFNGDSFFDDDLLIKELNISIEHKFLFFDYCEKQEINSKFLNPKNELLLLDILIKHSLGFKKKLNN